MFKVFFHVALISLLTILTQLGGLAWLISLAFRRRFLVFALAYAGLAVAALFVAPIFGRVPMSCLSGGALQVQSPVYCLTNRAYVTPTLKAALEDVAAEVAARHPGTVTQVLDGSFPFFDGVPLLPHLSHDDGEKLDIAFYFQRDGAYVPRLQRGLLAYFAFVDGPSDCPPAFPTLRWDMGWVQPLWPDYALDAPRMRSLMRALSAHPDIGKILLEPHLVAALGVAHPKVRFQGCRAARHDDHIHVQL